MASNATQQVLIVDDDDEFREMLFERLKRSRPNVIAAVNAQEAIRAAEQRQFDVAVLDINLPSISGLELLERLKVMQPQCEVLMLTGEGTIDTAIQSLRSGAFHYLQKPCSFADLEVQIDKAVEHRALKKENEQLRRVIARSQEPSEMIGESPQLESLLRLIERAAPSDRAILIYGETGTGKELCSRALHRKSARGDQPMVAINCTAIPETLLESELFGHEKGAFTGATSSKQGLFEVADGGTLFIDEIGELPG